MSFEIKTFKTREEAEAVAKRFVELIESHGMVSTADLHRLVDIPPTYMEEKFGWTDPIIHIIDSDGYILSLPNPVSIDF